MQQHYGRAQRHAKRAAGELRSARKILGYSIEASRRDDCPDFFLPMLLRRTQSHSMRARQELEKIAGIQFGTYAKCVRQFEVLDECLDFGMQSVIYSQYSTARIDLRRSELAVNGLLSLFSARSVDIHLERVLYSVCDRHLEMARLDIDPCRSELNSEFATRDSALRTKNRRHELSV